VAIFEQDNGAFQGFTDSVEQIIVNLQGKAKPEDISGLHKLIDNFNLKTADFFREERKLNIGVVGQVKAGKSSFLNTLLFGGQEILPKASTPKTATLTKMEYADENIIRIEYYTEDEWGVLEDNAAVDMDDEVYTSAREIVAMVRRNGIDPHRYLEKRTEEIHFDSYDELISHLNDYVGEDGKFTPIVKAVTLSLHKQEFEGLSIVDTPGLNDPIASRTIRTKEFIEVCDVVFFLSQSGSFLDKSDWTLLSSQLPQKGVKKLVLVASKYDSGVRDILRPHSEDDDIFGEDENTADNIPKACAIIRKKLRQRAKAKVAEFVKDLERRESSRELIEVIQQCANPVLVSSMTYNMSSKEPGDYTTEENNVFSALKRFSKDISSDLALLGNFGEVRKIFDGVVREKADILDTKSRGFVPAASEELKGLLGSYKEKAEKRLAVLSGSDREALLSQKAEIEAQMGKIKADIAELFGELTARLETEKTSALKELRETGKEYLSLKERTGTITHDGTYTTGILFWKTTHHYTYDEHYSYFLAADAIENIKKYSLDAVNQVEKVFTEALHLKELKRRLLNVVVNNFDMGSEKYDSSLFRIMVEEVIGAIEFPVFSMNISDEVNAIAGKFTGELTSAKAKTELSSAMSTAFSRIHDELCNKLAATVKEFKSSMDAIGKNVQDSLLDEINSEFEMLLSECQNRDKEIADYQSYILALESEIVKL